MVADKYTVVMMKKSNGSVVAEERIKLSNLALNNELHGVKITADITLKKELKFFQNLPINLTEFVMAIANWTSAGQIREALHG